MAQRLQPTPAEVLRFAEHVVRKVRTSRKDRLATGKITDAEASRDIACADELTRIAKAYVLHTAPLN